MPKIQDSSIHRPSGISYRYDALYEEVSGEARWSAVVSVGGKRSLTLNGTARFDVDETPAFSAVVASVRAEVNGCVLG